MGVNGHKSPIADRIVPWRLWAQQPPPPALVADWLPARGLAVIYGAPKTGKSLIALDLAAQATTGGTWAERDVTAIKTALYVAAEGVDTLRPRLDAWLAERDATPDIDVLPETVHLGSDVAVSELAAHIASNPYPLVIVDTWARCTVGLDEVSGRDMSPAVERLQSINPAGLTVALHHSTKAADKVLRGHSSLLAAIDSAIHVARLGDTLTLTAVEQRSMAPGATTAMRIDGATVRPVSAELDLDAVVDALHPGSTRAQWVAQLVARHGIGERTAQKHITEAIAAGLAINTGTRQRAAYEPRST